MSAIFEFGGRNPAVYETLKNVMIAGTMILIAYLWYQIGVFVGVIPKNDEKRKKFENNFSERIDINSNFTGKFDVIEDDDLLEQLQKSIKEKSSFTGTKEFLCCLISENRQSKKYESKIREDDNVSFYKRLRCYGLSKLKSNPSEFHNKVYSRKIARLNSATSDLDCENGNLVYQLSITNK